MTALEELLPRSRRTELDSVEVGLPIDQAWQLVRHGDLARSQVVRALFSARTLPAQLLGRRRPEPPTLRVDQLVSTPEQPGFQLLIDRPPAELVVGAIGKVWKLAIPFLHVSDPAAFTAFREPGWVKVGWALRLEPLGERRTRVSFELRVDATDELSWRKFRRYFRLIGGPSRFIRRTTLAGLARPEQRPLPGDALLPDARAQVTHTVLIAARPESVWPWLVQMGCRRGGFYSLDALDNGGKRSAREIHPELQALRVGDLVPATPKGEAGFEVLGVEPNRALLLGGLFDPEAGTQLPFTGPRPPRYWQVTWAFALEPVDGKTRLSARGRAAFPPTLRRHALWMRAAHELMQTAQLRHLKARAEGRLARDDWRDVAQGVLGAAVIAGALVTPMLRRARTHWGLEPAHAERVFPGDELIAEPAWGWTHGIEIDARPEQVWPWIAQLGADRGGFYSYQWLENVAGCRLRNAETVRPEWELREGDGLVLHPRVRPLKLVRLKRGEYFVAEAAGRKTVQGTWLIYLEPLGPDRTRLISRYRSSRAGGLAARLQFGPALLEPIGFAMDRQLLRGVKQRAERNRAPARRHLSATAAGPQPGR